MGALIKQYPRYFFAFMMLLISNTMFLFWLESRKENISFSSKREEALEELERRTIAEENERHPVEKEFQPVFSDGTTERTSLPKIDFDKARSTSSQPRDREWSVVGKTDNSTQEQSQSSGGNNRNGDREWTKAGSSEMQSKTAEAVNTQQKSGDREWR